MRIQCNICHKKHTEKVLDLLCGCSFFYCLNKKCGNFMLFNTARCDKHNALYELKQKMDAEAFGLKMKTKAETNAYYEAFEDD